MTPVQPVSGQPPSESAVDNSILLFDQESNRLLGLVESLDERGFKLKGHHPISMGQRFLIRLEAPAALLPPIVTWSTGGWSEITIESGVFLTLMTFDQDLDPAVRESLADYIAL